MQLGLILGVIILYHNSFSQSSQPEKVKLAQVAETHLDLVLNLVATNLYYGKSNSALADYRKSTLNPQVGLSMQAGVTPNFSLVPELYFMMKGGKLESNNPLTTGKTILRFYSVEMPLLARFHYNNFHVNAGPSIAYNFYGTNKFESTTSDLSFNSLSNGFKRWELGMQFGGGYSFRIKQRQIALDLRYNYGLTNISNSNEMYNRSFIVSLHFYKPWKTNPLGRNKNS